MWLCLNTGFLSIVDKAKKPAHLVVRARVRDHIKAVFPQAAIERTPGNDYLFRAEVPRALVAEVVSDYIMGIDYSNFKDSTKNRRLHDAYMGVWHTMSRLQEIPPYAHRRAPRGQDSLGF